MMQHAGGMVGGGRVITSFVFSQAMISWPTVSVCMWWAFLLGS